MSSYRLKKFVGAFFLRECKMGLQKYVEILQAFMNFPKSKIYECERICFQTVKIISIR